MADYVWAINGPFPFDQLGSGPFWLWLIVVGGATTMLSWAGAVWLKVWAHR